MPSISFRRQRIQRAAFAIPVSTLTDFKEAKSLANELISKGYRVVIQPVSRGFLVAKIGGVL